MTAHSHHSTAYDLIIIGFGMASHRLLQELGQLSLAPKRILVLGKRHYRLITGYCCHS